MRKDTSFVPIVTYHGLSRDESADGLYTLTEEQFESQMAYLSEKTFKVISLDAVGKWLQGGALPERSIVLTFDDGLESHYSLAFSILKRYHFQGAFFVNPATLNQKGTLTHQNLREMHRAGMEIGSHGLDHIFLTGLDEAELQRQLEESKKALEVLLGQEISFFSIPRGRYDRRILDAIKSAGYQAACTSDIGVNRKGMDSLRLRRWAMKRPYSLNDFVSVVVGKPKKHLVFEYILKQSAYWVLGHTLYEGLRSRVLGPHTSVWGMSKDTTHGSVWRER